MEKAFKELTNTIKMKLTERRKAVGGKGLLTELINHKAVCRAAPGFARFC